MQAADWQKGEDKVDSPDHWVQHVHHQMAVFQADAELHILGEQFGQSLILITLEGHQLAVVDVQSWCKPAGNHGSALLRFVVVAGAAKAERRDCAAAGSISSSSSCSPTEIVAALSELVCKVVAQTKVAQLTMQLGTHSLTLTDSGTTPPSRQYLQAD